MSSNLGEIASAVIGLGGLALTAWGLIGKGRESAQTREDKIRADHQQELADARAEAVKIEAACEAVTQERDTLLRQQGFLIDFLRDVIANFHPLDALQRKAAELLRRIVP